MSRLVCRHNKFGYCKYGNRCFRKHENDICENVQCNGKECSLRHPRNCKYFFEFQYCKFGDYCKFSHVTPIMKETSKEIDDLKEKLKLLKSEIDAKNKLVYKYGYDSSAQTSDEELNDLEKSSVENNECNLCDFRGKTIGGLKTHIRRKHGDREKTV